MKEKGIIISGDFSMQMQCLECPRVWNLDCIAACEVTGLHDIEDTRWAYEDKCKGRGIYRMETIW